MKRCKKCNVPLDGLLSLLPRIFLGVKSWEKNSDICNKCSDNLSYAKQEDNSGNQINKPEGTRYKCQICGRMIHETQAIEHVKAEEYLIGLIKKDHPQWQHRDTTCKECIDYYKRLVEEAEI